MELLTYSSLPITWSIDSQHAITSIGNLEIHLGWMGFAIGICAIALGWLAYRRWLKPQALVEEFFP